MTRSGRWSWRGPKGAADSVGVEICEDFQELCRNLIQRRTRGTVSFGKEPARRFALFETTRWLGKLKTVQKSCSLRFAKDLPERFWVR